MSPVYVATKGAHIWEGKFKAVVTIAIKFRFDGRSTAYRISQGRSDVTRQWLLSGWVTYLGLTIAAPT